MKPSTNIPTPTDDGLEMAAKRERLERERWRLENSFGRGAFADGRNQERIDEIDKQLAALKSNSNSLEDGVEIIARSICEAFHYKWEGLPESRNLRADGTEWPVHASFTNPSKDGFRCIVRDALAKANLLQSTTPPVQVPDGWMLVPKEPTGEMIGAGKRQADVWASCSAIYKAMLTATPPSPVDDRVREALEPFAAFIGEKK